MLQTIEIPCYGWLSGKINNILYDLEENKCTIKDIKILHTQEWKVYQILFISREIITWSIREDERFKQFPKSFIIDIYNSSGEIILEYSQTSLW